MLRAHAGRLCEQVNSDWKISGSGWYSCPRLRPALGPYAARGIRTLFLCCSQAWYATHPPKRGEWWMGTRPYVHQGFLKSWVANGLNKRIVERCVLAVKRMQAQAYGAPIKLYITGAICTGKGYTSAISGMLMPSRSTDQHSDECFRWPQSDDDLNDAAIRPTHSRS